MNAIDSTVKVDSLVPNLYLIGAAKSGTTYLANCLAKHSDIYLPNIKEPHLYDADINFRDYSKYLSKLYSQSVNVPWRLDATPNYLANADIVIPRMLQLIDLENTKFIVILRNPIDRAYSHYLHVSRTRPMEHSFMTSVRREASAKCIQRDNTWTNFYADGLYAGQINSWLEVIPEQNLKVLFFEDMIKNIAANISNVTSFLQINDLDYADGISVEKNEYAVPRSTFLMKLMSSEGISKKVFRSVVNNQQLRVKLSRRIKKLNRRKMSADKKPSLSTADRKELACYYKDSVFQLAKRYPDCMNYWDDFNE